MDAFQARLEQHPEGTGAPAFREGFPPAIEPGNVALEAGLLLLQPAAGALLQGQGFC